MIRNVLIKAASLALVVSLQGPLPAGSFSQLTMPIAVMPPAFSLGTTLHRMPLQLIVPTQRPSRLEPLPLMLVDLPHLPQESLDKIFAVARSFRYVRDGRVDYWQTPEETQNRRAGDCEDKAIWLFDRLSQAGYKDLSLVVGRKSARDRNLHVWVEYAAPEGRMLLDPAAHRRPWRTDDFSAVEYKPLQTFSSLPTSRFRA